MPVCASFGAYSGQADYKPCNTYYVDNRKYMCQTPDKEHNPGIQPLALLTSQLARPRVAMINNTTIGQDKGLWSLVTCPKNHVTYNLLACDAASNCWAGSHVTFSVRSDSWALPSSRSCPANQAVTSLPPSFQCRSGRHRVPYSMVCDHRRDCLDGSDETFCQFLPCNWSSQFQCLSKQVIIAIARAC